MMRVNLGREWAILTIWIHQHHGAFLLDLGHVRWIELDVNVHDYVFVAIEAGALVQSRDGGRTWIDRVEQGPYDTHTLGTHQKAPKRLYSSAGDGYFESFD